MIVYGSRTAWISSVGISASKRKIRRQRPESVKRLLREAFRLSKAELPPGVDLIIVPRGQA